jgi:phosphopantothenate synthetase
MSRALENIIRFVGELRGDDEATLKLIEQYDSESNRRETIGYICDALKAGLGTGDD